MKYQRLISVPKGSFLLLGPRGTGKSTWLRETFKPVQIYDLLSEKTFQDLLTNDNLFAEKMNVLQPGDLVIIDEIQRLPYLLNEVHRFIETKQIIFALSGSSARKLRKAGTNLLAGRAVRRESFPFLPEELGLDFNLEAVLQHGSIPLVWMNRENPEILETYVQTYLKEEIQAEAIVRNLKSFARFLPIAALFHGQVLSISNLSRDAGISRTSAVGYLEILEDTMLAFRLSPFEGKLRVKERKHPKWYWIDPGIARAARRRFGNILDEERGALFEGWIASLLKAYQSYRKLFETWNYWAPTESDSLEVDFLLWRGEECVAIEVKASERMPQGYAKGLNALAEGLGKCLIRKLVVYRGADKLKTESGIEILPVSDFLKIIQSGALFEKAN